MSDPHVMDPFAPPLPKREISSEEAAQKRFIYDQMSPRRRKFVDRLGYDLWDPFDAPKEPLDIRQEESGRTAHELVRDFMKWRARQSGNLVRNGTGAQNQDNAYAGGVLECALAIINRDEKYRGVYDFCLWYSEQLQEQDQ